MKVESGAPAENESAETKSRREQAESDEQRRRILEFLDGRIIPVEEPRREEFSEVLEERAGFSGVLAA